ncbi:MAG TPA: hypothetical protein VFE11_11970, partial [Dongiaceae bacterium]|nr:hypothetical protein [Dongiaceae bacterium]
MRPRGGLPAPAIFGPSAGLGKPAKPRARRTLAQRWHQNGGTPWQEDGVLLGRFVSANGSLGRDQMHGR